MAATHRPDLDSRERIEYFVDRFYERLLADEQLAPIFVDVAQIDLDVPLPHIKDYWCKCSLCSKWRIVSYAVYLEKRKATATFSCSPSCDVPHTDEEQAYLDEEGQLMH